MASDTNLAPRFGATLFQDNFDLPTLSSDWKTVGANQWIDNGWLHTKDLNGWPRDSEVVVHDGDTTWTNYSVSLTAAFTPGTPWEYINIPLRVDGYQRSSSVHTGNAYELELLGTRGWSSSESNQIVLNRVNQGRSTSLFRGRWTPSVAPMKVDVSLDQGLIQVSVNGLPLIDLLDQAPLMYGGVGVHTIWESEAQIDDLTVTALPSQTAFAVLEKSSLGAIVGTVVATDPDPGDRLTYAFQAGNTDPDQDGQPAFAIDSLTGVITVQDSGDLDAMATPDFHLHVQVTDMGGLSAVAGFQVQVLNRNDPPLGTNTTIRMAKNNVYAFNVNDFGFLDPGDSPANHLQAVRINTLPQQGLLTNRGIPLSPQQWVSVSDLRASQLVFTPFEETYGYGYATFSFQVQDDGGTANGGVDLSPRSNQITLDVIPGGGSWGDPHFFTFDGLNYDLQLSGDFLLTRALDSELEVQVQQAPWSQHPTFTLNQGLATRVEGMVLRFDAAERSPLLNGTPTQLAVGDSLALGQGRLSRASRYNYNMLGDLYTLTYRNGDQLTVEVYPNFCIDPTVYLIGSRQVTGLLGNNNGRSDDDLALRNGVLLPADPLAPEAIERDFAASWRLSPEESLFDRLPGPTDGPDPIPLSLGSVQALLPAETAALQPWLAMTPQPQTSALGALRSDPVGLFSVA